VFFVAVTPFALFPYAVAAALWAGATLAAYLAAVRAILPGGTAAIAALAAPPVIANLWSGQNGLLTAGLLGGALGLLDRRPVLAGLLVGALAYKPQFGVLLPLVLAITGRWLVFAVAAATVIGLVLFSGVVFGWDTFRGFAQAFGLAQDIYLRQQGNSLGVLHWDHLESVYGMLRALGFGGAVAWPVHISVALTAAAASLWITAGRASRALKAASLLTAALLVTPYSLINDLAILTVAMAFLVGDGLAEGFGRWDKLALTAVYLLPLLFLLAPPALAASGVAAPPNLVGLGPLMCALLSAVIAARLHRRGSETYCEGAGVGR